MDEGRFLQTSVRPHNHKTAQFVNVGVTECFLQTRNQKENLRNNNLPLSTEEEENRPRTMWLSWLFISSLGDCRRLNPPGLMFLFSVDVDVSVVCSLSASLTLNSSPLSHKRG